MNTHNENIPDPKEIEKEMSKFLTEKFGGRVKMASPLVMADQADFDSGQKQPEKKKRVDFNLKPEDLVSYLDQYIVKQDQAKAILSTKICTHFNRIKYAESFPDEIGEMVGSIKSNIIMIGPTGVGKTYMIKLIAKKIGVPFVKGDATKFSETGYVGGDVEDLVRDLVREADDDIELAQSGIIYIDEIDKIASSRNLIGADVSRTGVQRALLKPMEETEIDLKVPHDPISMIQEIERFRKTGNRDKRAVNTKNILFIVSGAFADLNKIIKKRVSDQGIGFGAHITGSKEQMDLLQHVKSEDLIEFGFESEFVGRLPVIAIFEYLAEDDLFEILKNPSNPIVLGKKLDFAVYDISVRFDYQLLRMIAKEAFKENTGARGLVSAVERALLPFEKRLPSTNLKKFPATCAIVSEPDKSIERFTLSPNEKKLMDTFDRLRVMETDFIKKYVNRNKTNLANKYSITLTPSQVDIVAKYYADHILDIGSVIRKIKSYYDEIKKIELYFFKNQDINIVLEEEVVDLFIEQLITGSVDTESMYKQLSKGFEHGLKLVRDKTGKNRFFITKQAVLDPEGYVGHLLKDEMNKTR
jgi:endopeptidase Clp ATP-binding regulatory subunit ClpX